MNNVPKLICAAFCIAILSCNKHDVQPTPPTLPKANFTFAIPGAGLLPTLVNFTSTSTNATSYSWSFGDGNTSTSQNPSNTYNAVGTYNVKLVVTGAGGKDSLTQQVTITLNKPKPSFTFIITDNGNYPTHVSFTNTSTGASSYHWVFDNGDTSNLQNPVDSFFAAKTFNVKLIATNAAGKDSVTVPVSISINKPTANFTFSLNNNSQAPCNASFVNASTNAVSYKWTFSNGSTSTATNPQTTYSQYRVFNVKLVATNPVGSDSITKSITVNPITNSLVGYLITPRDNRYNPAYYNAVLNATLNLQIWYKAALGNNKTFALNTLVIDTLTGLHDSVWYNNYNGTFSGTDPRYYGYYNTFYEMQQLLGSRFNTSTYDYFVYVAAPGGGAGAQGFCALGDQDLKGLLGINPDNLNPNRWIGGDGHELGHSFGLAHPADQNPQAIMWTGYLTYPNCILEQSDKDILNANPIFR